MSNGSNKHGNLHGDNGHFVNIRDYVERIFEEKEKSSERDRVTLELALIEARSTTERAMQEAKVTVERALGEAAGSVQTRLLEAKAAADDRETQVVKRLENLESGGAPFASRLDQSITRLLSDVDGLKTNMVKTTVVEALREKGEEDIQAQRKQIKYIFIAAALSLALSLLPLLARALP